MSWLQGDGFWCVLSPRGLHRHFVPLALMAKVEMEVAGLSQPVTEFGSSRAYVLVLREKEGSRRLPIVIGQAEGLAINTELQSIRPPRPLTHDLLLNVLRALDATLTEVTIYKLQDATFYAYLLVETGQGVIEIDCRPSDGVALALRAGAPIYCEEEVLRKAAQPGPAEDESEEPPVEEAPSRGTSVAARIKELERLLQEALAREDYEMAARIRDELRRLQGHSQESDS